MEQGTKRAPRRGWNAWGDVLYWGTRVGVYIGWGCVFMSPLPGLWPAPTGDIWVRLLLYLALLPYGALVVLSGGVLRGYCRMRAAADGRVPLADYLRRAEPWEQLRGDARKLFSRSCVALLCTLALALLVAAIRLAPVFAEMVRYMFPAA